MATREMAIAPPIFNREIKDFAQILTIVCTIMLHPYFGFLLVQTKNKMKITNFYIFPRIHCLGEENEFN